MRYADHLHRECVAGGSAHDIARRPLRALALWVARRVARPRVGTRMHRNSLNAKMFFLMHPQYDIVLM